MKISLFQRIKNSFHYANRWFYETPDRALEQAYNAALQIKAIEDEHFEGQKISMEGVDYGDSVMSYFQSELSKNLSIAKRRLAEFNTSRYVVSISGQNNNVNSTIVAPSDPNSNSTGIGESSRITLEKLKFIDRVISKYTAASSSQPDPSLSLIMVPKNVNLEPTQASSNNPSGQQLYVVDETDQIVDKIENISDQTGVLPRSILKTFTRLTRELNPKAEEDVVKKFRTSQAKTAISLRFVLLLIVVPLLTFQVSKLFFMGPVVDRYFEGPNNTIGTFINEEVEEEALHELERFESRIKFDLLVGKASELSSEEREERLKEKAKELEAEYSRNSADAIKNILSDFFSLVAFAFVIFSSRREIEVLKSFLDEIVYGLSDSAKAFLIILFTDVFVGFHSPHGWEVILEGISKHWGIPENREFIFLFIATFPVVLDTIFKYWIFRYLNRISPSAVATYRNMNE